MTVPAQGAYQVNEYPRMRGFNATREPGSAARTADANDTMKAPDKVTGKGH
jgi:hypothetical protein